MLLNSKYDNQYINTQFLYTGCIIFKKINLLWCLTSVRYYSVYVIQFFLRNNNWYKKNFKSIYSLWIWRNDSPYVIPVHAGDEDLPLVVVYKQPSDHFVIFFASYNKLLK